MRDSQYVGEVGIGTPPQFIAPIFDTGSTNLWAVHSRCPDRSCQKVRRFNPAASSTFYQKHPLLRVEITFGTGSVSGTIGEDTYHIGPFRVHNQTFGLVEKEMPEKGNSSGDDIFDTISFEGIVGLAFPQMSTTGNTALYDNLMRHLSRPEFAFYVSNANLESSLPSAALFLGGVDPRFFDGPLKMVPVVREHYWEVELLELWIGDTRFCCHHDDKHYVIFDTGTSYNTVPTIEMRHFLRLLGVNGALCDPRATPPNITYVMQGATLVLTPDQYLLEPCKPAYMQLDVPSEFGKALILGSFAFMRHYFTLYRRAHGGMPAMIGIAPAKHQDTHGGLLASLSSMRR